MTDLQADLRTRWLPSAEQMKMANALLAAGYDAERPPTRERGVYTAHILTGKHYGFWTADIEVVPIDGVFLTRAAAQNACLNAAKAYHEATGNQVCGGWAWHMGVDEAAVWDDIMAEFPTERSKEDA
jgi:hypothetical protein